MASFLDEAEVIAEALIEGLPSKAFGELPENVYGGASGIALFLAALHRATEETGATEDGQKPGRAYRDHAEAILSPIAVGLERLEASPDEAARLQVAIGGLVGIASLIYAFRTIADLLDEPRWLQAATATSCLITPERIRNDQAYELMFGASGALLALLDLHDRAPEANAAGHEPFELAVLCGDHLVDSRTSYRGLPAAWSAPDRAPMSGMAHGATGIAVALASLYRRTDRRAYLDAALDGLAFERALFVERFGNWLDRPDKGRRLMSAWCYGAPGITLGRAALLGVDELADDERLHGELEAGLDRTLSLPLPTPSDHLCCGNFGRCEILAFVADALDRPELRDRSIEIASATLARSRQEGRFQVQASDAWDADPTLFKGTAGIGYALLRFTTSTPLPWPLLLR